MGESLRTSCAETVNAAARSGYKGKLCQQEHGTFFLKLVQMQPLRRQASCRRRLGKLPLKRADYDFESGNLHARTQTNMNVPGDDKHIICSKSRRNIAWPGIMRILAASLGKDDASRSVGAASEFFGRFVDSESARRHTLCLPTTSIQPKKT